MILAIAWFEIKKRLRMLSTWIYFAILLLCAALMVLAAAGAFSGVTVGFGAEKVHANSPYNVRDVETIVALFALIIVAGVFGQALHEDVEHRVSAILFSTPMKRSDYLAGRFLGAFVTSIVIFAGLGIGAFIAGHLPPPITEPTAIGPSVTGAYAWPYVVDIVPNILVLGVFFFGLAAITKRMMPVYVGAIVLLTAYLIGGALLTRLDSETVGALVDPFGRRAAWLATKYWTVTEKNTRLVPLTGIMLANRALWLGIAGAFVAFAVARFRPTEEPREKDTKTKAAHSTDSVVDTAAGTGSALLPRAARATHEHGLATLLHLTARTTLESVKNTYFVVIVLAGVAFMCISAWNAGNLFDTPTWPVTARMLEGLSSFDIFVVVVLIFSAGEIVWRERDVRIAQIVDALPLPTWTMALSKVLALEAVLALLTLPMLVCGVAIQTLKGYHHYELGLYASELALHMLNYMPMAALTILLQVFLNNKYIAHFINVVLFVGLIYLSSFHVLPNVLVFGNDPGYVYSDMNGYGHLLGPTLIFRLYWVAVAAVLVVIACALFVRGTETARRLRLTEARRRARMLTPAFAVTGIVAAAFFGVIAYQTLLVHTFHSGRYEEEQRANYEKAYKKTEHDPIPRVTDVKVAFDVYPHEQKLHAKGVFTLTNKTANPIDQVMVTLGKDDDRKLDALTIAGTNAATMDDGFGVFRFTLSPALAPGATTPLAFDMTWAPHGFQDSRAQTDVVDNGTFVNSSILPRLGYAAETELDGDNDRKKYGLAPRDRLPPPDAPGVRDHNEITPDADFITYDATVSTSPEQIAVMPGYLDKEWTENGRRYFHYTMDAPILDFYSVLSANYTVRKDRWDQVALEVYFDAKHPYNVDRMFDGMKDALSYCSASYGPYQHRQLRILEFPRYHSFAQSFPNTVPFSESIGFIARYDPDDDSAVDYPYFVTAHETAHQWWAHQVIGARVQGVTMLSETLAEYTALMVMKHKYGDAHMRRFLAQEADGYLRGRAFEQKREVPLMKVEEQTYIHYNKGGHVMYELQDAIGEENVDAALRAFLEKWKGKGPPYPVAQDLVDELKAKTPPEQQGLIADLFETITLYDLHTTTASCAKTGDGKLSITLDVFAKKLHAGELGEETEVAVDRPIEIGVLDDKGEPLAIEKRALHAGRQQVTLSFSPPANAHVAKAGVDPLVKLLDRKPSDNVVPVSCP